MSTNSVNGNLFKKMITNGAINLSNHQEEVNQLNVFPVPDGDTGTNMTMTIMTGVKEVNNSESTSIVDLAKVLQRGLLMGARGNSGVILSQFFRGVYVATKQLTSNELSLDDFINCLESGYKVAYKAVMEPTEGTVLTVMRESAEYVVAHKNEIHDFEELFDVYLKQANESLQNTPNLLPVLKDAGVVDSGGAGFVKIMTGMGLAIKGEMLDKVEEEEQPKFAYALDFVLHLQDKENFVTNDLRSPLSLIGDEVVIENNNDLVHVTAAVNDVAEALASVKNFGTFVSVSAKSLAEKVDVENVVFTKDDQKAEHKKYALVAVCFGEGVKQTFKDLGVDYIIDGGQTMNPSTESFVKAINTVNADNIIIIPNNGNVILSAEQSIKICHDQNIRVLKAKTIAQGYASLMAFDETADLDTNFEAMTDAIKNVKSGEITYAVRDTEIKGVNIKAGDYMGIVNGEIVISVPGRVDACKGLFDKTIDSSTEVVTIFVGQGVLEEEVNQLEEYARSLNDDIEVEVIQGDQDIYSYIISIE